jgi:hypothetical protein
LGILLNSLLRQALCYLGNRLLQLQQELQMYNKKCKQFDQACYNFLRHILCRLYLIGYNLQHM